MIRVFMIGYSERKGGVETYISNLTAALPRSEVEVIYSLPRMEIDGKVWKPPATRHNYPLYYLFWRRFFRETKIDVLYYNACDVVSIDPLKFAKKAGIPIRIIHSHASGNQIEIKHKMDFFHKRAEIHNRKVLHHYATHFFACSEVAGQWMFDGRPYTLIKNGINLDKYRFSEEKRNIIRKRFGYNGRLVGIIGRLSPVKNTLFIVRILKELITRYKDVEAVIIGTGEMQEEMEEAVKQSGVSESIRFVGAVDNVDEWISAIDVLLMPSLFEGLPFVLVEAQAAGLPCVVSTAISREAALTDLVDFISLESPLEVWIEHILQAFRIERRDYSESLIQSGYSIKDTAEKVMKIISDSKNGKVVKMNEGQSKQ